MIRRILVPTDFSEPSLRALELAITMAEKFGADLHILHALHLPPYIFPDGVMIPPQDFDENIVKRLRGDLEKLAKEKVPETIKTTTHLSRTEQVPNEIVRVSSEISADLVVMGTHGRTGIPRMLLGSVAERVVRTAPCPVLTLHGNQDT